MSDVSVDIIKNRSGEAPDLPSGANLSGVSTAATLQVTNLNPTHINASGVTTATTFSGSLKSTGTPTLGLGVTINSSGINISGVATAGIVSATTLYGDGSNLTGVAMSIAPISYNPDVTDTSVDKTTGIGITFTELIKAGSGNVTLSIANAGVAGTVVENFGVGSSVTINQNRITIDPTSDLNDGETYHVSYPSGSFTNTSGDVSYVGTAYTFGVTPFIQELWAWGENQKGQLGQNLGPGNRRSSPVQVGTNTKWSTIFVGGNINSYAQHIAVTKNDGTLWSWGYNEYGVLAQNNRNPTGTSSSPVQIPGTTWSSGAIGWFSSYGTKTDGTLWVWGRNGTGQLGLNSRTQYSSPVQLPGTTWSTTKYNIFAGNSATVAVKTDGTLWTWGAGGNGQGGRNATNPVSSPTQIPGTTWSGPVAGCGAARMAIKTDGTLWGWGNNQNGALGQGSTSSPANNVSSPIQIPGTTWKHVGGNDRSFMATKTDGTLWGWGHNDGGSLGQNNRTNCSSPIQIPGTTWDICSGSYYGFNAIKTDGTLWTWGANPDGNLGQNNRIQYSSPVQVPGSWVQASSFGDTSMIAIKQP